MRKDNWGLLPHYKENIYGFDRNYGQIIGWEISKFNINNQWQYSTGNNVKIGVIDTGCDIKHDDLITNLGKGKNLIDPKKDPIDDNGHGTHITGTICAANNGLGMVGVAPNTTVLPVKALNSQGNGNESHIAEAIRWCVDNGCDIIAMSLGSPKYSSLIHKAVQYATKYHVGIFCAAGNSGKDVDIMYPAKFDETISIGSVDRYLNRSNFTCSGESLEFLAPGQDIFSCSPNNEYCIMSGTSMANPFAVGCASLILSYLRTQKKSIKLSKQNYIEIFKSDCIQLKHEKFQHKMYQGYGILKINITPALLTKYQNLV